MPVVDLERVNSIGVIVVIYALLTISKSKIGKLNKGYYQIQGGFSRQKLTWDKAGVGGPGLREVV